MILVKDACTSKDIGRPSLQINQVGSGNSAIERASETKVLTRSSDS
jgi:hypothetical protein